MLIAAKQSLSCVKYIIIYIPYKYKADNIVLRVNRREQNICHSDYNKRAHRSDRKSNIASSDSNKRSNYTTA